MIMELPYMLRNLIVILFCVEECLSICPNNGIVVENDCYWVTSSIKVASNAQALCASGGGGLAVIPNPTVQDAIKNYKYGLGQSSTDYYLGYKDLSSDGSYLNLWNGGIQTWSNWATGSFPQPNDITEECVVIYGIMGYWWDEDCDKNFLALCSNNTGSIPDTTTAVTDTITALTDTTTAVTDTTTAVTDTTTAVTDTTTAVTDTTTAVTDTTTAITETSTSTGQGTTHIELTSTDKITTSTSCTCNCSNNKNYSIYTTENLQKFIGEIQKELLLEPKALSSAIRKLECADDPRPSAATIGYLGVLILFFVFGGIFLADAKTLFSHIKMCFNTLKNIIWNNAVFKNHTDDKTSKDSHP